ncbi:MAG: S8/S53 family peptidase, partial [Trueperaceae bacterium]|nr:S8/S53 family peptidase [Trueperaceae bacterium]
FSSELAARLMALVLDERSRGLKVATNGLHHPDQSLLLGTTEGGAVDAFTLDGFDDPIERSGVVAAWQFMAGHTVAGPLRRVRVAIIDGGFAVMANGGAFTDTNGASDFPAIPLQFDFVREDPVITGVNAARCSGGSACPWHGHGSASVAAGVLDNGAFRAGTGGQVADAILLNIDLSTGQVKAAVDRARALGAEVINMSFGGECGFFCRIEKDASGYYLAFGRALQAGIVMIAAAGNDGEDSTDVNRLPCALPMTICVGALGTTAANGAHVRANGARDYSNHGSVVNIFAPTTIPAWYGTNPAQVPGVGATFGGTSAAAPYVAGVVAMMRSLDPTLSVVATFDILIDTAWKDSPDPKVGHSLNAFEAVRRASAYRLPPDRLEPNDAGATARTVDTGSHADLTIHAGNDADFFQIPSGSARFVDLGLTYPHRLGRMSLPPFGRETSQTCGLIEQVAYVPGTGTLGATYRVPAGAFVYAAASPGNALPYQMQVGVRTAFAPVDRFEANDTFATASSLGDGGYVSATLHSAGDVDYYRVFSRGAFSTAVLSMTSMARVESADSALTLQLYSNAGSLLGTSASSADCSVQATLAIPGGFHVVRVSGPAAGEYRLWLGSSAQQHPLVDIGRIIYLILHPNEPVEFILREPEAWFAFNVVSDFAATSLQLEASGLRMTLYAEDARTVLGEGVVASDLQSVRLDLPGSSQESALLVRVTRGDPALVGGELPLIPGRLTAVQ